MEEKDQLTTEFKLKFLGYGEWVEEPDCVIFTYKDYECRVVRVVNRDPYAPVEAYFGGHLCGYVRIPHNHPYHHKKYEDMDIDCHYGLTFGELSDGHWIGFDCAHMEDLIPTIEKMKNENVQIRMIEKIFPIPEENTYKNMNYCIEECKSIVDQLIVINQMAYDS